MLGPYHDRCYYVKRQAPPTVTGLTYFRGVISTPMIIETKTCARCKEVLPVSAFPPNPKLKSGLHSYCRPCRNIRPANQKSVLPTPKQCVNCRRVLGPDQYMKNINSSDGLRSKCKSCTSRRQILKKYGLTSKQYAEMAKDGCTICGSYYRLHIDHDHKCCPRADSGSKSICGACVRGILCSNCNTAIGMFNDDPVRMLAAIEYVTTRPT